MKEPRRSRLLLLGGVGVIAPFGVAAWVGSRELVGEFGGFPFPGPGIPDFFRPAYASFSSFPTGTIIQHR